MVFDKHWFNQHQSKLLWLLNNSLTRKWFRWVLCIDSKEVINRIEPNAYWFGAKKKGKVIEVSADFRTHNKYAKRLFYAFKPLWYLLHFYDWILADRLIPTLSFGFSTLTVFPDAGDPGTTSCDGSVQRSDVDSPGLNETYTAIHNGAGTGAVQTANTQVQAILFSSTTLNQFRILRRIIWTFDTSPLTSAASISAVVLSVWGTSKSNALGSPDFHVCGATPASNTTLVAADYGQTQSTSFANVSYASYSGTNTTYTNLTLDANGIANVSKTGISRFSGRQSWDVNNSFGGSWVSNDSSSLASATADTTGTSNDPKLVVTYTIAVPNYNFFEFLN